MHERGFQWHWLLVFIDDVTEDMNSELYRDILSA